jgi:hypothetical protein
MSTIKDLRNIPGNSINIIDVFNLFTPQGKTKYVSLMMSLIKKTINVDKEFRLIKNRLMATYKLEEESFDGISPMELILMNRVILSMFDEDILIKFKLFCDYNERGLIQKNDLTSYESFTELMTEVSLAELKETEKDLESQVIKLYDDKEWLVIKPLTALSSRKYGSGTKWCTASDRDNSYFNDYTRRGILIYCINRKTNYKVACFRAISDVEVTFWNTVDTRIDSFQTELPDNVLSLIRNEVLNNLVTNASLIPESWKKEKLLKNFKVPGLKSNQGISEQIMEIASHNGKVLSQFDNSPQMTMEQDKLGKVMSLGEAISREEGDTRQRAEFLERHDMRNYIPEQVQMEVTRKVQMSGLYEKDMKEDSTMGESNDSIESLD